MSQSSDLSALIAQARLPERTVQLCLRGDLLAEWDETQCAWAAADRPRERLVDGADRARLAARLEELREQMQQATLTVRLRALPRRAWDQLVTAHQPREGNAHDAVAGFNVDTFWDALVRASVVEPELSEEDWTALLDTLTSRQFEQLADPALRLNRREVSVPFWCAASPPTGDSASG